jgi:hypothetical protein
MSLIKPAKLLPIRFTLGSILPQDAANRYYRYSATLKLINPQAHSGVFTDGFYNLTHVNVGDYVATNGAGRIMKIVEVLTQSYETAQIYVEDELRLNQQQDSTGNSTPYTANGEGIVFEVKEGRPILFPYSNYSESIIGFVKTSAMEIMSRFDYLRADKLLDIEQAGSSLLNLQPGDIVTWDENTEQYRLFDADDKLIGVVVETGNPVPDAFRINPAGNFIDIELPDFGDGKRYYYWDVTTPGKLTTTEPSSGQRKIPVFFKINNNRAIHFEGANVTDSTGAYVTIDTTQTITGEKTFDADQTFAQSVRVEGDLVVETDVTVQGNFTVSGLTTILETTNTAITDQLIELNQGYSGPPLSADSGIVINRGPEDNLFFGWDESSNQFTVGTGSFDGSNTGELVLTDAGVRFGATEVSDTLNVAGLATLSTAVVQNLVDNQIVVTGAAGILESDPNLSWDGSTLGVVGTGVAFTTGKFELANEDNNSIDHTLYVMYGTTNTDTQTELFLDNTNTRIELAENTTMMFEADIIGRDSTGVNHCAFRLQGLIDRTNSNTILVNNISETVVADTNSTWSVIAEADNTNNTVSIKVTGDNGTTIRWTAFVKTTSIQH